MIEQVETQLTDTEAFKYYADKYEKKKSDTLINLLECGQILYEAKHALSYGMFTNLLEDPRVNESPRTSQRFMLVYRNFRHILTMEKRPEALSQLGVTHLLELQKLPERFRKKIEVIENQETKIIQVIDEEKLGDFLDQHVDLDGKSVPVRELPLKEMKRQIQEVQGIYEPDKKDLDEEMVLADPNTVPIQPGEFEPLNNEDHISSDMTVRQDRDKYGEVVTNLSTLVTALHSTRLLIQTIDIAELEMLEQDEIDKIKKYLQGSKEASESFMIKVIGVLDNL